MPSPKDHWNKLATAIGIKVPESAPQLSQPETAEPDPAAGEPQAESHQEEPPSQPERTAPERPARPARSTAAPPNHWRSISNELGIEAVEPPPQPKSSEIPPPAASPRSVQQTRPEPVVEPKPVEFSQADDGEAIDPLAVDQKRFVDEIDDLFHRNSDVELDEIQNSSSGAAAADLTPAPLDAVPALESPVESTADSMTQDTVSRGAAAAESTESAELAGDSEDGDAPVRRRRRRRGRRRRRDTEGEAAETTEEAVQNEDAVESASAEASAEAKEEVPVDAADEAESPPEEESGTRRRRSRWRRGRRGGRDRDKDKATAEDAARPVARAAADQSAVPDDKVPDDKVLDDKVLDDKVLDAAEDDDVLDDKVLDAAEDDDVLDDEDDSTDIDGDDAASGRPRHKKIPSWSEAIEVIVTTNLASRERGGRRGRRSSS